MNVSCIATTEGYSRVRGVVYLWDGQSKKTLFTGATYVCTVNDSIVTAEAERCAFAEAAAYVREHLPVFAEFLPAEE